MKILQNFIYNFIYQILIIIIPTITVPYVSRVLGVEGVGIFSLTTANISVFVLIASIGVNTYGNREIAYYQNDIQKRSQVFWEINLLRFLMSVISLFLSLIFIVNIKDYQLYYCLQVITIIAGIFDVSWFFMGLEDFKRVVTRNLLIKVLSVVLIFIFVKNSDDLSLYILINSLSILFGNLSILPSLRNKIIFLNWKQLKIYHHFKPALLLFLPQISGTVFEVINKNMLSFLRSVDDVGFFNQSNLLFRTFLAIVTALGVVMLPRMSALISENNYEQIQKLLIKSSEVILAISLPIMFGLLAISKQFVPFFFGEGFDAVILLIIIESFALPISGLLNVVGMQYLIPTNQLKYSTVSYIFGSVSNLLLNFTLIPFLGVNGTMLSFVLAELFTLIFQLWVVRHQIKINLLFTEMWKYFLSGLLMFVCVFVIMNTSSFSVYLLISACFIGVIIYFILIYLLKTSLTKDILAFLSLKLKK
ncbi:MAG: polysaccharide biosynthesis C-terminal domain-containing protein [Lactovum sp.]